MSGHSHWAGIKYKKQIADTQKGKAFSKLAKEITVAAKEGGDPEMNPKLRVAIEKAKKINMSSDNIERAIKRGTGEISGEKLEEVLFEAYGPGGIAILMEGITDNKNRAINEVKQILEKNKGKLVGEGGVRWMFERKGCIALDLKSQNKELQNREKIGLIAIEAGVEDLYWHNGTLDLYTEPKNLEELKKKLIEKGVEIKSSSLDWVAKKEIKLEEKEKKGLEKLFEDLDTSETVQEIYSNLKI
ncbi:transcriptional regulator [Parcubacteria bacterium DG_74_2]|nr:MAG: transcriptional regulator [Parcubacteria bacterium DG_74_2]